MKQLLIVALVAVPAFAQPAARLTPPVTARAAEPDSRAPAAQLGPITSEGVGGGDTRPAADSAEERYNRGVPRTPATTRRDDERGAKLRAPGRLTGRDPEDDLDRDAPPPPPRRTDPGPPPTWWPERERDLEDFRATLPAFGERDGDRLAFASDCAFDDYPSPITNPFLAEDPRSLTELRPIYMYQSIPGTQYYYQGGSLSFLGFQGRAALTDRFSVVVHKVGWTSITRGNNLLADDGTGFSEIWLGPKFTFFRNPQQQTLLAAGIQFQMPIGAPGAFQNTGGLSIVPWLSYGRELGQTDFGTFRMINAGGVHLGTDDARTDYFFDTLSLSFDVGDNHRFYPMLELSWFHYLSAGGERPYLEFEGRDLANIGGNADGDDIVSIAPGFRFKFSEFLQLGLAFEVPLLGSRDLLQYRVGIDLIWRY